MSLHYPTLFIWDGEAKVMRPRVVGLASQRFVNGETYALIDVEDRSVKSHDHEFAWLSEAWKSLPEHLTELYPTATHLRKRALIQAGFYNETIIDAGSNAAALRVAVAIRSLDEFALVFVRNVFVVRREAKSQSRRSMDKAEFQASKDGLMVVVAELLGVPVGDLPKHEAA